jgi:hypothetical protein
MSEALDDDSLFPEFAELLENDIQGSSSGVSYNWKDISVHVEELPNRLNKDISELENTHSSILHDVASFEDAWLIPKDLIFLLVAIFIVIVIVIAYLRQCYKPQVTAKGHMTVMDAMQLLENLASSNSSSAQLSGVEATSMATTLQESIFTYSDLLEDYKYMTKASIWIDSLLNKIDFFSACAQKELLSTNSRRANETLSRFSEIKYALLFVKEALQKKLFVDEKRYQNEILDQLKQAIEQRKVVWCSDVLVIFDAPYVLDI